MAVQRYNLPLHPALRPYLRYCCVKTVSTPEKEVTRNSTQADLWPSLVVLKGPVIRTREGSRRTPVPRVTLMGAAAAPFEFEIPDGSQVIGFNFQPGRAHPFFGEVLEEFTDRIVPLSDAWGADGRRLEERIDAADTPEEVRAVVEAELLRRLGKFGGYPEALPAPLQAAIGSKGRTSVESLAHAAGVSARHLKRLFDQWVGLSPKVFNRIVRFQAVLGGLAPHARPDWAGLSFEHGYADQSHLIRDFEAFAGLSPSRFFDTVVRTEDSGSTAWKALQPDGLSLPAGA